MPTKEKVQDAWVFSYIFHLFTGILNFADVK